MQQQRSLCSAHERLWHKPIANAQNWARACKFALRKQRQKRGKSEWKNPNRRWPLPRFLLRTNRKYPKSCYKNATHQIPTLWIKLALNSSLNTWSKKVWLNSLVCLQSGLLSFHTFLGGLILFLLLGVDIFRPTNIMRREVLLFCFDFENKQNLSPYTTLLSICWSRSAAGWIILLFWVRLASCFFAPIQNSQANNINAPIFYSPTVKIKFERGEVENTQVFS